MTLTTAITIPCPKCERPTELGEPRHGWRRCICCGAKFKLAEYVDPEPAYVAQAAKSNSCQQCGVALRQSARHCHRCGAQAHACINVRSKLIPAVIVMLAAACLVLGLLLVARPPMRQATIAIGADTSPALLQSRQQVIIQRQRFEQRLAAAEAAVAYQRLASLSVDPRNRPPVVPDKPPETASLHRIHQEEALRTPDVTAPAQTLFHDPTLLQQPTDAEELKRELLAAKAELARFSRQEDAKLAEPASANRANWQALINLSLQKSVVTPEEVRRLLGSPNETGATYWCYRPYSAKGRVQWSDGQINAITLPNDLPR